MGQCTGAQGAECLHGVGFISLSVWISGRGSSPQKLMVSMTGGHIASGSLRTGAHALIKLINMVLAEPLPHPLPPAGRGAELHSGK